MSRHYYAVIPAAGSGSRFGGEVPKQYLQLNGVPLIRHTIGALLSDPRVLQIVVVLAPEDSTWTDDCLPEASVDRVRLVRTGGATRADSVINGINWLFTSVNVNDDDWVLVHDAARPCLEPRQLAVLIDALKDDPVGGLLAIPVADTLKRADTVARTDARIEATVDRSQLWQAQTPQMFRLGALRAALSSGNLAELTDEASAIERSGQSPKLVPGGLTNLKVTFPEDLALASMILGAREINSNNRRDS